MPICVYFIQKNEHNKNSGYILPGVRDILTMLFYILIFNVSCVFIVIWFYAELVKQVLVQQQITNAISNQDTIQDTNQDVKIETKNDTYLNALLPDS